jgi:hypothetical protein
MGNQAARQQQTGLEGYGPVYDPNNGMNYYGGSYDQSAIARKYLLYLYRLYVIHMHIVYFYRWWLSW